MTGSKSTAIEKLLAWNRANMKSPLQRFLEKIDIREGSDCIWWSGSTKTMGYGKLGIGGRSGKEVFAHRLSYQWFIGPIPDGMQIDHICKNRACVNPSHLRIVTPRENKVFNSNSASAKNALKTHCPKGHPLFGDNLVRRLRKRGWSRECKACTTNARQRRTA